MSVAAKEQGDVHDDRHVPLEDVRMHALN